MTLIEKLYKSKNPRCLFIATADAAVKRKIYSIYSMPELSDRKFFEGFEMKFTSPLVGLQQAGAPETAAKSINSLVTFG